MTNQAPHDPPLSFEVAVGRVDPCEERRQMRRTIRALSSLLEGRFVQVDVGADSIAYKYSGRYGTITKVRPAWDIAETGYLVYVGLLDGLTIACEAHELTAVIPCEVGEGVADD